MIAIIAYLVIFLGLAMDAMNLYLDFKSIVKNCPSGIILVPIFPYLIGSVILFFHNHDFTNTSITFLILVFVHIFVAILLPYLIMMVLNITHHRNLFNFNPHKGKEEN